MPPTAQPEQPQPQTTRPTEPPPAPRQSLADTAFIGALAAIGIVLASRLLLLLATIGAFVLAVRAADTPGLLVLIAYSLLTVAPLTALDIIAHRRGGT